MAKGADIDSQLRELSALRADVKSSSAQQKLTEALKGRNNLLAARAATIIFETQQTEFLPLLASAFDRFFTHGSDKGCAAKTAIAEALYTLGETSIEPFLRGIRHVQMEPTYGGQVDAAAELRGTCALGLVRAGYRDVLLELPALLMDREPQTRQIAVRAVVYANDERGALLLRMKILAGDQNPDVLAEATSGLMKLSPGKSFDFVKSYLDSEDPAMAEAAALAIGGARTPAAFEVLQKQWQRHITAEPRAPLLLGMAMTRQAQAIDFLIQRIQEDSVRPAIDAITALAMYKHDEAVRARVSAAVVSRAEPTLQAAMDKSFYVA